MRLAIQNPTKCVVIPRTFPSMFAIIHSCGKRASVSTFKLAAQSESKKKLLLNQPCTKHARTTHGGNIGMIGRLSSSSWYEWTYVLWMQYSRCTTFSNEPKSAN